jgi:hypothetical protein
LGKVSGLTPKIQLYTVPGQAYYEASRKLVLRGADGIVFVADSATDRLYDNLALWRGMKAHLAALNIPLAGFPIVVQLNKQDLPNATPPVTLKRLMQVNGYPAIEAVAVQGQGVFDTLKAITNGVIRRVRSELA